MERKAGLAQRTAFVVPVVPWTPEWVAQRLRQAMAMVSRLPNKELRWVNGGDGTYWPEILYDRGDIASQEAKRNTAYVRPGGAAVDDADEALAWVLWLEAGDRGIVLARSAGEKWNKIVARLKIRRASAGARYAAALQLIADRLNGGAPGR